MNKPMNPAEVIKGALSTEKSLRGVDTTNTLVFIIDKRATKEDVKQALKLLYSANVQKVNTVIINGRKKAYVTFASGTQAKDIATTIGVM